MTAGLFGESTGVKGRPKQIGIEFTRIGDGPVPESVRISVVDRETGKRVGSRLAAWDEFSDIAVVGALVLVNVDIGRHE